MFKHSGFCCKKENVHYPPGNAHIFLPFDTFESMIFLFARWDTVDGSEIPSNPPGPGM